MSLTVGVRIGSYEIVSALGAGGMGAVYRARDTKLGRDVAIKILPDVFATDTDRLVRFEREARTLASLNHPNIAQIYGVEDNALILELVDGEDLSDIVARSALPLGDALSIARQIALALEAAHDAGVIHRDLKPANIKVRRDGTVKVLDFGLAKTISADESSGVSGGSALTSPATTGLGVILGTASYMSPEQARGRPVDRRSDLWAFGVVLFEMISGRHLFGGDTITDVIAAVVTREPDWSALPATTPAPIRRLLRRCLEKDPARRLRDAADAGLEIDEVSSAPDGSPAIEVARGGRFGWLLWSAATALAFAAGAASLWIAGPRRTSSAGLHRLSIARPGPMAVIKVSPDGQWLVAEDLSLKVRRITESAWRDLPGTSGGYFGPHGGGVFWSPDSRSIGFQIGESLKRIDVQGSPPETICDRCLSLRALRGASWNSDGVIVVSAGRPGGQHVGLTGLWRISENGGEMADVTSLDSSSADNSHRYPSFLPDGKRFLFTARRNSGEHAIMLGSLDGGPPEQVALGYSTVAYASGYLLFVRSGNLLAASFDASAGKTTGDPILVAERVHYHPGVGYAHFSVSEHGMLVINEDPERRGVGWVNREGRPQGLVAAGVIDTDGGGRLSRDDARIVLAMVDPEQASGDIYAIDLTNGQRTRLTSDPRWDQTPTWGPTAASVIYRAPAQSVHTLFIRAVGDGTPERRVFAVDPGVEIAVNDWSPDGKAVFVEQRVPRGSTDLMILTLPDASGLEPWLATPSNEFAARLSADGRWVVYVSDEGGSEEVYVRAFRNGGAGRRVTSNGGNYPVWSRDDRELFFVDRDGMMVALPIVTGSASLTIGTPQVLFDAAPLGNRDRAFDVDKRGRFLMNYVEPGPAAWRAEILLDWSRAIRE